MKVVKILLLTLFTCITLSFGNDTKTDSLNIQKVVITDEMRTKYPIKSHHEHLAFDCVDCHVNQGDDPSKFKNIGDNGCMSCHKSKQFMAKRLKFMDTLKANPHNSVHDGPTLYCDECHFEHQQSTNMCIECHEHEVVQWMGETP